MKLVNIDIQNLRCIESLRISPRQYTSLIGPNNAGKSSTLRAIEILLNQQPPALDEWRKGCEDKPIIIEAEFGDIQDWERKAPGVAAHVFNHKIKIRMSARIEHDAKKDKQVVKVTWESFRQVEAIEGWPEDATFTKLDKVLQELGKDKGITAKDFGKESGRESLRSAIREKFPEKVKVEDAKWTGEGMSIPAALQQALPQAQLIPAMRDASEDGKPGAKTSYGELLDRIILPAIAGCEEYQTLLNAVQNLKKRLHGKEGEQIEVVRELAKEISDKVSELIDAKVILGMEMPDAKKFIGGSTLLHLDDGTQTRIALQGHGLQRALIFAMLEILAVHSAKGAPAEEGASPNVRHTVLLFEEPELFIHPHLMRRLKETLVKISQRTGWQVIVSTHSPFLVDVGEDPCSLVIHRRPNTSKPPAIKQLESDPFSGAGSKEDRERLRAVLDFHPTVCEAFFAKHVVLVEGDSEIAVLVRQPTLYKLAGLEANAHRDVTVVSCDGKWTIIPIARLLKEFGIPFRIIHDKDSKGKTPEELADIPQHEFHANKRIAEVAARCGLVFVVDDTFEDILWEGAAAPSSKKDKPYRAWKRVRDLCQEKVDLSHAPKLKELVEFAFKAFPDDIASARLPVAVEEAAA